MHIDEVKKEIEDNPDGIYIISGCGRSGTSSCAEYLGGVHEPRGMDFQKEVHLWSLDQTGVNYVRNYIIPDITTRPRPYVEVNSLVAPVCNLIKKMAPEVKIYHLHRNEDDVVASIMKRENYTDHSEPRNSPPTPPECKTREEKVRWFVQKYDEFMKDYPQIKTETIPIIRNES